MYDHIKNPELHNQSKLKSALKNRSSNPKGEGDQLQEMADAYLDKKHPVQRKPEVNQLEKEADQMGSKSVQMKPQSGASLFNLSTHNTIQRVVLYEGNFDPQSEEPDVYDDQSFYDFQSWNDAQQGLKTFQTGDQNVSQQDDKLESSLSQFENEKNFTLIIKTVDGLNNKGETTFSVWDGTKFRSISETGENPATSEYWPTWVTSGNAIKMEISIQAGQTKAQIAHTLNHEISLHAISDLKMIQKVRAMANPLMATNYVNSTAFKGGVFSSDYAHAQLGADKNQRLKATHESMKVDSDEYFASALDTDYQLDVSDHAGFVPQIYIPPHQRKKIAGTGNNDDVAQLSKTKKSAQDEMNQAMQNYQEDEQDDDYSKDDDDDFDDTPLIGQLTPVSCGIAAVQMVMASKGLTAADETFFDLSRQFPGAYDDNVGTTMSNMAQMLKRFYSGIKGPSTMPLFKVIDALKNGPVIARVEGNNGHFVVIDSATGTAPEYDGERGVRKAGNRVLNIRDPWPPGRGEKFEIPEDEFQNGGGAFQTTALYIHF